MNNYDELRVRLFNSAHSHFQEMTNGQVNVTELIAALICEKDSILEGMEYVQEIVDGSMTMLVMTKEGIYAARDRFGRTPLVIGHKEGAYCVSFESHAYINLGYNDYRELGPAEIAYITPEGVETLKQPGHEMKICSFLWVYYGYPTSSYEGVNVEEMRYKCGSMLAKRDGDSVHPDSVAGVPGFRCGPCNRLRQRIRNPLCEAVYQIYANLAPFFYAHGSESEESDCTDEADSCTGAD